MLAPGEQIAVDWPFRLIQAGTYRIVVERGESHTPYIITSPFIVFQVERKPVVESGRILPVALGVPLLLLGMTMLLLRSRKR